MDDRSGRVTVHALTKRFGAVAAVRDLSFTVEPGSVTGFLGPNGSGKTTTLRMILGLVWPTLGEARINGARFGELEHPARVVGAVLEAQGFHPRRSAVDHLRICAAAIGVPDARVDDVLGVVGLADARTRPVGGYSLGMTQRLALAVALLGDPQVLVLDEPANGLDPEGIAWLRRFLQSFARRGGTVLVSSHLLAEIEQAADHVVVISEGRCVYQGGLDDLRASRRSRVLVRSASSAALAEALAREGLLELDTLGDGRLAVAGADVVKVGDVALAAGVAIYGMVEERIDLEQLFFQLTSGQYAGWQPGAPATVPPPAAVVPGGGPQPVDPGPPYPGSPSPGSPHAGPPRPAPGRAAPPPAGFPPSGPPPPGPPPQSGPPPTWPPAGGAR